MSLVHEALQKAEREKQRKTGVTPPALAPKAAPVELLATAALHVNHLAPSIAPARPVPAVRPASQPKSQYALLSVLIACVAVVAIVAIVYLVSRATSTLRESREAISASTTPAAPTTVKPAEVSRPLPVPPTVAQPPANADSSQFKLTGIMKDPGGEKFAAVLNGRVVYEGYTVDGAIVKKIERDQVTLDAAGQETVLRLN